MSRYTKKEMHYLCIGGDLNGCWMTRTQVSDKSYRQYNRSAESRREVSPTMVWIHTSLFSQVTEEKV